MNVVLLSGGSGKRLWPLSNESRSKQFLKLIKNDSNEPESMVQRVYRQIRTAGIEANIVVATGKIQVDSIKNQLGDFVDMVVEPERRDTFPAIALAASYLSLVKEMKNNDVILVLPVDPFAEIEYFDTLKKMEHFIMSDHTNIALMGIKPTYPSTKYGYIVPKSKESMEGIDYYSVECFQEKPTAEYAEQLINKRAMWNGGVFAFKLGYLMDIVNKYIEFDSYQDVERQYNKLPKISFDYEVVEKEKSIAMIEYHGTWKDLGTWNTITEVMEDTTIGNVIMAETCENSHIINELDIPITVLGTKNLVIAASPDGILVSDKYQSSFLKQYVENISQRPMYEEREWGRYKVIDLLVGQDGIKALTKRKSIKSNEKIPYQIHKIRSEVWTILSGECIITINDKDIKAMQGDTFSINRGDKHGIIAITDVDLLEVQFGEELNDDGTEFVISRGYNNENTDNHTSI